MNPYNDYIDYHDITREEMSHCSIKLKESKGINKKFYPLFRSLTDCTFRLLINLKVEMFYRRGHGIGSKMLEGFLLEQSENTVVLVDVRDISEQLDQFLKGNNFISLQPLDEKMGCYFYVNNEEMLTKCFDCIFADLKPVASLRFSNYLKSIGISVTLETITETQSDKKSVASTSVSTCAEMKDSKVMIESETVVKDTDKVNKVNEF